MKWSFNIGRILGIDLYLHFTFLLLLAFLGYATWQATGSFETAFASIVFIATIFGCVLLHELGHALMARRYGIKTRDITLLPIGGIARLERMPENAIQELWVALAGPAVSLAIAALLFLWIAVSDGFAAATTFSFSDGTAAQRIMAINLFIVGFNLLPAFPMDGGRVLRAALSTRIGRSRATAIAANVGQGMAILFGVYGFFYNPFLVFIAVIVFLGAQAEAGLVEMQTALKGLRVRDAMMTRYQALAPSDTLDQAVDLLLAGSQQDFPVIDAEQSVGMLRRNDLVKALRADQRNTPVSTVMLRDCHAVQESASLLEAIESMGEHRCSTVPVMSGNRLVGLLSREHISEMVLIHAAIERHDRSQVSRQPPIVVSPKPQHSQRT